MTSDRKVPLAEQVRPIEAPEPEEGAAGYIEYLNENEVLDAYARAQRESPGALIHLEPHVGHRWSLQVYASEAAKEMFRVSVFYQCMALSLLSRRLGMSPRSTRSAAWFGACGGTAREAGDNRADSIACSVEQLPLSELERREVIAEARQRINGRDRVAFWSSAFGYMAQEKAEAAGSRSSQP